MISALTLLLTADCNLRCEYCYANSKQRLHMDWATLHAALDFGLTWGQPGVKLIFSGGEPLLQFPMIERAVAYVKDSAPSHAQPMFVLLTNGTLLDEGKIRFLTKNRFEVQLSFDGVAKAQNIRGAGTFDALDRLLATLALRHRDFLRRHVKVSMTVTPRTVGSMADSVRYFLRRGVERIAIAPSLTDCSGWRPGRDGELRREFERVSRASLSHHRRTGKIPVLMFGGRDDGRNPTGTRFTWIPGLSMSMCGIVRGEKLTVDADGEVSACVTLAGSYQRPRSALLREAVEAAHLGNVRSRSTVKRLTRRDERAGGGHSIFSTGPVCPEIFLAKEDKRSSYRSCRKCRYFTLCLVCPVSIAHAKGRRDPRRIPDFECAFNFAAASQWEAFRKEVSSPPVRPVSESRPQPCRQARVTGKRRR